jgi:hypothetical protein
MKITVESTTKMVTLNGNPARIWEGKTENGIPIHVYITRIAHSKDLPLQKQHEFKKDLLEQKVPSAEIEAIPTRLIL